MALSMAVGLPANKSQLSEQPSFMWGLVSNAQSYHSIVSFFPHLQLVPKPDELNLVDKRQSVSVKLLVMLNIMHVITCQTSSMNPNIIKSRNYSLVPCVDCALKKAQQHRPSYPMHRQNSCKPQLSEPASACDKLPCCTVSCFRASSNCGSRLSTPDYSSDTLLSVQDLAQYCSMCKHMVVWHKQASLPHCSTA